MRAGLDVQDANSPSGAPQPENTASSCGKHRDSVMLYCCCVLKSRRGVEPRAIAAAEVIVWTVNGCTEPSVVTSEIANAVDVVGGRLKDIDGTQEGVECTAADSLMVQAMTEGRVDTTSRQR